LHPTPSHTLTYKIKGLGVTVGLSASQLHQAGTGGAMEVTRHVSQGDMRVGEVWEND